MVTARRIEFMCGLMGATIGLGLVLQAAIYIARHQVGAGGTIFLAVIAALLSGMGFGAYLHARRDEPRGLRLLGICLGLLALPTLFGGALVMLPSALLGVCAVLAGRIHQRAAGTRGLTIRPRTQFGSGA